MQSYKNKMLKGAYCQEDLDADQMRQCLRKKI